MRRKLTMFTITAGLAFTLLSGCGTNANAKDNGELVTAAETLAAETKLAETEIAEAETAETEMGQADSEKRLELIQIRGQVLRIEPELNRIVIDSRSENVVEGELVLNISDENTKVLDAVDGYPVSIEDIAVGEMIYAYIGPAMTLSLPPISSAAMILCKIPADFRVPSYITVSMMEKQEDGSYQLTGTNGTEYSVPADCVILPFLTRNMVYLEHVKKDDNCLVWMGEENQVVKIVLFAD